MEVFERPVRDRHVRHGDIGVWTKQVLLTNIDVIHPRCTTNRIGTVMVTDAH